ncbi:glycosyltransferase family 4 protein [Pseudovibrio sp. Tun.PSC04-5.I4]|uniref:glycosyltransferase family 4 protein n=1 Tax=Pseudovibrio sp. Tun.PSC04-5.I4 TaxID=1798213 RepID=UPI00087EA175|nr:glycosyltransferase family 4 protein [Pseudovibrio sp. Tun.PSC04-5.I4]SDR12441.1 Glycosyltransferase involved in cell wall bisynthesis [Pseudovibrio sp. Tun.PSC04-5.I4]
MSADKLKIIHCIRAPWGGAFRHLLDLVETQIAMGHELGIVCASEDIAPATQAILDKMKPDLSLGLMTAPMARSLGPKDVLSFFKLTKQITPLRPDVLHGHGAKGGVWARTIGTTLKLRGANTQRIYSPHGGSLHYDLSTISGKVYITLEKLLKPLTDAIVFTSAFEKQAYATKIGLENEGPRNRIVHNGLRDAEFEVSIENETAADLLFIGELRMLKGVDLLINALSDLHCKNASKPTLAIVGAGPDRHLFEKMVSDKNLQAHVRFYGYLPFKQALPLGKIAVIPSRAEALPYIVLELLAAQKPLITTRVGGIPEIYADYKETLVQPDDQQSLTNALEWTLSHKDAQTRLSMDLQNNLKTHFTLPVMAKNITQLYQPVRSEKNGLEALAESVQQSTLDSRSPSLRRTAS